MRLNTYKMRLNTYKMRLNGFRTTAPEENCPPTLTLTLTINQTLTLTGRGEIFLEGNCPDIG